MKNPEMRAVRMLFVSWVLAIMCMLAWPQIKVLGSVIVTNIFPITGTTNNTAMSFGAQGINNNCNPGTDYQIGQGGANFAAMGLAGCVTVAVGSTNQGANGIQGTANNASTTTNAVGGYLTGYATAAGSGATDLTRVRLWGINPLLADRSFTNVLLQNEFDFNIGAAGTKAVGIELSGAGAGSMSADSVGVLLLPAGSVQWPNGFRCQDGATINHCVSIGPTSTGNNVSSQVLELVGRSAGGAQGGADHTATPAGNHHFSGTAGTGTLDININGGGSITPSGLPLASLTPTTNGTIMYCTDCLANSNPCTATSTGAIAKRLNGTWDCR